MPIRGRPTIGIDASRAVSAAPTGTEAYSAHLIRALVPLLAPDHDLRLYTREAPERPLHDPLPAGTSVETQAVKTAVIPFPRLWTHVRLSWEMLRRPPDLLFVPSHVLPVVRPKRTLVTVHDLGYLASPKRIRRRSGATWRRVPGGTSAWLPTSWRTPSRRATPSSRPMGHRPRGSPWSIPGYEPDLAPVTDPAALTAVRQRYGIPGDYVLFIGRIQPRKNLARLIEAFARVHGRPSRPKPGAGGATGLAGGADPGARGGAGTGRQRAASPAIIAAEDKAALISGARVFAYPSLYEGFGFPALEAQACGTPLLASNTSSLPEVAGEGGLLVDPEDTDAIAGGLRRLLEESGAAPHADRTGIRESASLLVGACRAAGARHRG